MSPHPASEIMLLGRFRDVSEVFLLSEEPISAASWSPCVPVCMIPPSESASVRSVTALVLSALPMHLKASPLSWLSVSTSECSVAFTSSDANSAATPASPIWPRRAALSAGRSSRAAAVRQGRAA